MTDVANCMKSSTPRKASFGQIFSDAANDILSPEVREAMDRIFPQSASQFLQGGLSFEEEPFLSIASNGVDRDEQLATLPLASAGSSGISALTSMATTENNTEPPPVAVSAGAVKSFFEPSLVVPAASSVAADSTRVTAAQVNTWQSREAAFESESNLTAPRKKMPSKARISRADFEIITSCDAVVSDCERAPQSASSEDIVSDNNNNSNDGSDSEDMSRPFASITREKKKKKRKRAQIEPHTSPPAKSANYLSEHNVNSEDAFKTSSKSWNNCNSVIINGSSDCGVVLENNLAAEVNMQKELLSASDLSIKSTQDGNPNSCSNGLDICPVKDLYKYRVTASEDTSNTSNSSAKENVLGKKRVPAQKLPKVKRDRFHIMHHVNKIKITFPPCCVVLRKIDTRRVYNANNLNVIDNVLSLPDRVRCLNDLCDKGYLVCKRNRKVRLAEKLGYLNFLEEALFHGTSEDEFEKPQKRSLRKRAKIISYAEPGEDDIVEEFSSTRSRAKAKDESVDILRNDIVGKHHVSDVRHKTEGSNSMNRYEYAQCFENNNHLIHNKEQLQYPPSAMNGTSTYNPNSAEAQIGGLSQLMFSQSNSHSSSTDPFLSYLSGLSTGTVPAVVPSHMPSFFPPMPLNISGSLPTQSYIEQAPFSYQLSSMGQDPQQLLMNMSAKELYLQLLSSSGVGAGRLRPPAGVPADKSVGIPPQPMFSQALPQVSSAPFGTQAMFSQALAQVSSAPFGTQAMFRPPVASVSNVSMMPPVSAHMSSLYGLPLFSRPMQTSSHSITPASLPLTSPSHGHMSTPGVKPFLYTSYGTANCSSTPMTAPASTSNSMFIASASSSSKAITVPFTPMSVPYVSSVQNTSLSDPAPHPRPAHVSNLQSNQPTTPGHGSEKIASHGSDRFTILGSERFANLSNLSSTQSSFSCVPNLAGHGSERFVSHGSERFANLSNLSTQSSFSSVPDLAGHASERFVSHGSERFTNLSNLSTQSSFSSVQNRASHGSERFTNLSNLSTQSSLSAVQNLAGHGSERFVSHGSERFTNLSNLSTQSGLQSVQNIVGLGSERFASHGSERFTSHGSERLANLSNLSTQSSLSTVQNSAGHGSAERFTNLSNLSSHSSVSSVQNIAGHGSEKFAGHRSERFTNLSNLSSHSSVSSVQNIAGLGSERFASHGSERFAGNGSERLANLSNLSTQSSLLSVQNIAGHGSERFTSHASERFVNLSNLTNQSRLSSMQNRIAEKLSYMPSPVSQSRSNMPSPVSQSRSDMPSPISQSRSSIPSPIAQSGFNIPSQFSQSRIQNTSNPFSQPRMPSTPNPISQSRSNIPSPISQSRSNIPSPVAQSRSNIPSPISQSRPNIPSPISQSRPNIPSPISQSRSNMASPFSQLRTANLPSQSPQPPANHISQTVISLPSPDLLQRVPKQPVAVSLVRAVTPSYAATVPSGGLATSISLATSGQSISELPATGVVIPQHKRLSDQVLSDQHAAKRRKLQRKYPLPPGVIIKTERLDSPPEHSSNNNTPQPLVPQNSQLFTLVPGHSAQGSEIISQSNRGSSGASSMAACNEARQPNHVPVSLGLPHLSSDVRTSVDLSSLLLGISSADSVTSSLAATTATSARSLDRLYTSSTPLDAVAAATSSHSDSRLPPTPVTQPGLTDNSATSVSNAISGTILSSAVTFNPPKTSVITSFASSASPSLPHIQPPSSASVDTAATPPSSSFSTPAITENLQSQDGQQHPSPRAAALSSFRNSLTELQMFVQAQVACGLRTERLDQLKGLLLKKQQQYEALQKFVEADITSDCVNRNNRERRGSSEAEPFVID